MPAPLLREARRDEAALLADLGRRTFTEAFGAQNEAADLARFLDATYREDLQSRELADPAFTTLLALVGGHPVGFVQLRRGPAEAGVTGPAPVELQRLYVLQAAHGQGVGVALMEAAMARARAEGFATLWLGVWEHNLKAQAFYRRWGFRDVGSHVFLVGGDPQTDRIWECPL